MQVMDKDGNLYEVIEAQDDLVKLEPVDNFRKGIKFVTYILAGASFRMQLLTDFEQNIVRDMRRAFQQYGTRFTYSKKQFNILVEIANKLGLIDE